MMTTTNNRRRAIINATGLSAPKAMRLEKGIEYWLGTSSMPKLVTITWLSDEFVEYEESPKVPRVRCERWIAEDFIATGCVTKLQGLRDFMTRPIYVKCKSAYGWVETEIARIESLFVK